MFKVIHKKKYIGLITVSCIVFTVGVMACYTFYLAMQDSLYFKENTFKYYIFIDSKIIKDVPKAGNVTEEYYFIGSAPNSSSQGIMYTTNIDAQRLKDIMDEYLLKNGYEEYTNARSTSVDTYRYYYDNKQDHTKSINMQFTEMNNRIDMTITEFTELENHVK